MDISGNSQCPKPIGRNSTSYKNLKCIKNKFTLSMIPFVADSQWI